MSDAVSRLADQILDQARLYTRAQLNESAALPPDEPGAYGWWFLEDALPMVPAVRCRTREGRRLLYVGVAPERRTSRTTLRDRIIGCHFDGKGTNSTLRADLGLLLENQLRTIPEPRSPENWGFSRAGESELSRWMSQNAAVNWLVVDDHENRLGLEHHLMNICDLPLNLKGNKRHAFRPLLAALRELANLRTGTSTKFERRKSKIRDDK